MGKGVALVKVLGRGELSRCGHVKAHAFSKSAECSYHRRRRYCQSAWRRHGATLSPTGQGQRPHQPLAAIEKRQHKPLIPAGRECTVAVTEYREHVPGRPDLRNKILFTLAMRALSTDIGSFMPIAGHRHRCGPIRAP